MGKLKDLIVEQQLEISALKKKNSELQDSETRRQEWLDQAKREAGYSFGVSFDVVWRETLELSRVAKLQKLKNDEKQQ